MLLVTNPGSNLPRQAIEQYEIAVSPQQIVVGGEAHDTRSPIAYSAIDRWVRTSAEFPHVVGTTAHEFVALLGALARKDPEIAILLTSKRIIQSHAAALSAVRTLAAAPSFKDAHVEVVDTRMTDGATGLCVIAAAEARRAGLGLRATQRLVELLSERGTMRFVPGTLEHLVKGGRATWLRVQVAGLFKLRPLIGFRDGELTAIATVRKSTDDIETLLEDAVRVHGAGRPVWIAALHSEGSDERALALLARARTALDVRYAMVRQVSASIYLHVGPGGLGLAVLPVDGLGAELGVPPIFGG